MPTIKDVLDHKLGTTTTPPKKKWNGTIPDACEICSSGLKKFFYDFSLPGYGWAIGCHNCFTFRGGKLGLGLGQKYDVKTLEKVGG